MMFQVVGGFFGELDLSNRGSFISRMMGLGKKSPSYFRAVCGTPKIPSKKHYQVVFVRPLGLSTPIEIAKAIDAEGWKFANPYALLDVAEKSAFLNVIPAMTFWEDPEKPVASYSGAYHCFGVSEDMVQASYYDSWDSRGVKCWHVAVERK